MSLLVGAVRTLASRVLVYSFGLFQATTCKRLFAEVVYAFIVGVFSRHVDAVLSFFVFLHVSVNVGAVMSRLFRRRAGSYL